MRRIAYRFGPRIHLMSHDHHTLPRSPAASTSSSTPNLRTLTLGALGVVFGDIGTSPLYAFKQCFTSAQGVALNESNVLGILSLIVWSLLLVISLKYVAIMLRADNRGEGGVLALSTLVADATRNWKLWTPISVLGMLGAALFFGDGMLTPAISVLSAVEGVSVAAPQLEAWVIPTTLMVLTALFAVQKRGTESVGTLFGPIIIVWFVTLGVLGVMHIVSAPQVLWALHPEHAVRFFAENGLQGFLVLSAVFLCVTGGEALYADVGHFGRIPIRNAWFHLVLPTLTLNYLGQGALVLQNPDAIRNPFYLLAPSWFLGPLIVLATAATIIASQAVISGVFSVATQAMNLGYLPRLRVLQSSESSIGQVYVPAANWTVFVGTVLLVLGFQSSDALASAYGIAVSATMLLAGFLVVLAPPPLRTPQWFLLPLLIGISLVDLAFFSANVVRAWDGGWIPIAVALAIFLMMSTWREGRRQLNWTVNRQQTPLAEFTGDLQRAPPERTAGTAVYLTNEANAIPLSLVQQLRFHRFLHERVIILTFARTEAPRIPNEARLSCDILGDRIYRITARYGFMERPDTVGVLRAAERLGIEYEPDTTFYVVGRTTPVVTDKKGLSIWRKRFYSLMARNTRVGYEYFRVPNHRLLEIGAQIEI
jgi:KUP system potassium uptake protein